jgi:hypothetical protein
VPMAMVVNSTHILRYGLVFDQLKTGLELLCHESKNDDEGFLPTNHMSRIVS